MFNKYLSLAVLGLFAAGCGLEAKTYVMTKPRVGLDQGGNAGCLTGKCESPAPAKTTRKVYVLELTKPVPESEVRKIEEKAVDVITEPAPASTAASTAFPQEEETPPAAEPRVNVPVVGELPGEAQSSGSAQTTTYTVQKDDTLQKISKKVYGTYGKWYKIYEANKDKIKNPNILKPGTVLTIPSLNK